MMSNPGKYSRGGSGFALVEAVLAMVVMSVAVAAALATACSTATYQLHAAERAEAGALADDLASEIMYQPYQDPIQPTTALGTEPGERTSLRADFNDVDDYTGWQAKPPQNKDGTVIPYAAIWTRSVVVNWVLATDATTISPTETGVKRVVITVSNGAGVQVIRTFLRTNHP